MQTALVTGAAGFIGSHLCESLLQDGWRVVGVDCFDSFYDPSVKRQNVARCLSNKRFSLIESDIRDRSAMQAACALGIDVVVHLAARAGVRPSIEDPPLYQDVNVYGTCVLLEAVRAQRISRVIFASSSSVYGNSSKVPFSESDNVDNPISPYAATKKAGELLCHTYHHLFDINIFCLRFFTVYGARQRPDLAIHKFTRLIEEGSSIPVFGDGSMMRDHTYIEDIISGVRAAMDRCKGYRIYNLGESQPVSLSDLIAAIETALGKKAAIQRLPRQPGDVDRTYADVSRATAELGFRPSTSLAVGLEAFVRWFRSQNR
jgi:UDP-glucuronate 4-epimerase